MKKDRFEMFSDGVMAIIITLLIIEIKLPEISTQNFEQLAQDITVYALSFIVIAITWLNHHNMFLPIERVNTRIIWINFLLLFFMSLIPLATKPLEEHFFKRGSHMFYGAVLAGVSFAYTLLQINVNKVRAHMSEKSRKRMNRINWSATILYSLSIPLSSVSIYLSAMIFVLFPIIYFIPYKPLADE